MTTNRVVIGICALLWGNWSAAGLSAPESIASEIAVTAAPSLPPYRPVQNETSELRLAGDPHFQTLVPAWNEAFRRLRPDLSVSAHLVGSGIAMPALYLGVADVALFGRDLIVTDRDGFSHVRNYPPLRIELGQGSEATPGKLPAIILAVHRDNPLREMSRLQVDAIFSSLRRRGAPAAIRTWGQMGLTGEWAEKPIQIYASDAQSDSAQFFQRVALGGSNRMNWEHYHEFRDRRLAQGVVQEAEADAAEVLDRDRFGLAVTTLPALFPSERMVVIPLEKATPGKTADSTGSESYPWSRPLFACVDRPPDRSLDPKVRAWLEYILSPAGQAVYKQVGGYRPLSPGVAEAQLVRLRAADVPTK